MGTGFAHEFGRSSGISGPDSYEGASTAVRHLRRLRSLQNFRGVSDRRTLALPTGPLRGSRGQGVCKTFAHTHSSGDSKCLMFARSEGAAFAEWILRSVSCCSADVSVPR